MGKFSRFFIERPVLANVLAIVIVLLGAVNYFRRGSVRLIQPTSDKRGPRRMTRPVVF